MERKHSVYVFFVGLLVFHWCMGGHVAAQNGFVGRDGTHFVLDGKRVYVNGFNSYWLMIFAADPSQIGKVSDVLSQASEHGLTVARTWAFSDGGCRPLQYAPGIYNETMFQALDFVVSEAGKHGIKLIFSLVNNYKDFGGRPQYVEWAQQHGRKLTSDDDFYTDPVVRGYYKNHVKTVLTRVNTINGIAYKDDPTIFAWELINEPRCMSDMHGRKFQNWIAEMAAYLKSIDNKHMLEIGLEGFYGDSVPDRTKLNPDGEVGTDFIANNRVRGIDFATIHAYSDQWLSPNSSEGEQIDFVKKWLSVHVRDTQSVLKMPLLFTEFGLSYKDGNVSRPRCNEYYKVVYETIYDSAKSGGSGAGSLFWQLFVEGMDGFKDGYEVVFSADPSTANVIKKQSEMLKQIPTMFARSTSDIKIKGL